MTFWGEQPAKTVNHEISHHFWELAAQRCDRLGPLILEKSEKGTFQGHRQILEVTPSKWPHASGVTVQTRTETSRQAEKRVFWQCTGQKCNFTDILCPQESIRTLQTPFHLDSIPLSCKLGVKYGYLGYIPVQTGVYANLYQLLTGRAPKSEYLETCVVNNYIFFFGENL